MCWLAFSLLSLLPLSPLLVPTVTVERNLEVKMRDGTVLRADVYRPAAEGRVGAAADERFPVLLTRTPYNKMNGTDLGYRAAARGYIVVIQDVRGRFRSQGDFYPFLHEAEDGRDTVEWAAALPGSDGRVGMYGASYVGATQLLAATAQPPHLRGLYPAITAADYYDGWVYHSGALEQWFVQSWTSGLVQDALSRRTEQGGDILRWVWQLPLDSYPLFAGGDARALAPYYLDWLAHPIDGPFWRRWSIRARADQVRVPACHVGGWYDIFLAGTLRNYVNLRARGGQRLVVGPWRHGDYGSKVGELDFGPAARIDSGEQMLRFYDHLFKHEKNGLEQEKPVRLFVMGDNAWREEDEWPLARARPTRYYLHTRDDRSLGPAIPRDELPDRYRYDPADPVPTRGGALCCDHDHLPPGPQDQRAVEARRDVLVYRTAPFPQKTEVTGPIRLELYASSTAAEADFTAKLVDLWPNGFAHNLADGILRARHRGSLERADPLEPNKVYRLEIDVGATSNVFLPGHRMLLEVSSSNFPRFDRSPARATLTVYHDARYPSALIVPLVSPAAASGSRP